MHVKTTIPYLETFKIRNKSQLEFAESLHSQLEKFWFGKENNNRKKILPKDTCVYFNNNEGK